jgi:hypothetical protein
MFGKKGALELSITSIVVLIIAITLLGFAIFFIKSLFGGATEIFQQQFAQMKDQLRQSMQETGEALVFNVGTDIEVKRGKRFPFFIGVKNDVRNPDGTSVCYKVGIKCKSSFTPADEGGGCVDSNLNVFVGGLDDQGNKPSESWFVRLLPLWDIPNNDIDVQPAEIQITRAKPDTYIMELYAWRATGYKDCAESGKDFEATPFVSPKRFRITVST